MPDNAQVETVKGPVDVGRLGQTLMHEHIFVIHPEFEANFPDLGGFDPDRAVEKAIQDLRDLKAAGIDTFVDVSVLEHGRNIPLVKRVADAVDINVIVATGVYIYSDLPHYLRGRQAAGGGDDPLVTIFTRDIVEGIAGTGVKAGIIKVATDLQGMTPDIVRVLRAAARTHRRTGAPITTHTSVATRNGLLQQDLFDTEGVDLSRVIIGHCGDTTDIAYLEAILQRGSYIGMDRFGLYSILSMEKRVDTIAKLCERGWAAQMVLSHDGSSFIDWIDAERLKAYGSDWHFRHISQVVLPALRERGVTSEQIDLMLVDNPRRIFAERTPY